MVAVLLLCSVSLDAWAREYPVDPEFAKVQAEEKKEVKKTCGKIKSPVAEMDCRIEVYEIFEEKGVFRGTEEYVAKHYAPLEDQALFDKYMELKAQYKQARLDAIRPGELDQDILKNEQDYIKQTLVNRWKKQGKDPWRTWHRLAKDGVIVD
jgi:hypothetical protein